MYKFGLEVQSAVNIIKILKKSIEILTKKIVLSLLGCSVHMYIYTISAKEIKKTWIDKAASTKLLSVLSSSGVKAPNKYSSNVIIANIN